jgi:hypothetical protein
VARRDPPAFPAPADRVGAIQPPTFRDGGLVFYPTLLTVRLDVGRRVETTRFIPPDTPDMDEAIARLDEAGFERTKMHQALAIRRASNEFPCRQISFVVPGETFYATDRRGVVGNCHAAWDAARQRFDLYPARGCPPDFFAAVTKVEYPG